MTRTTIDFSEKRREKRFPISSQVKLTLKPGDKIVLGVCMNISGSGLMVQTEKAINLDKDLLIDIAEGKIEYSAEGTVVRCEELDGKYLLGIKVTNQLK